MTETAPRTKKEVKPFDYSQPIALTLHQTPTSNVPHYFNGPDAAQQAEDKANELASNLKRPVAFFVAQAGVAVPPEKPTAGRMDLKFGAEKEEVSKGSEE
jgi:hypothetical protein